MNTITKILIVVVLVGMVAWALSVSWEPEEVVVENNEVATNNPRNATYIVDDQPITLEDGVSTIEISPDSTAQVVTKYFGNEVSADFDANGTQDTAFIMVQETGGSAVFFYLAVALRDGNEFKGLNTVYLGDRIAPQTTEYINGKILVNYADREEGDPFTEEPTVGVSKYFVVINKELVEIK